jgi:hypothetical protein
MRAEETIPGSGTTATFPLVGSAQFFAGDVTRYCRQEIGRSS